MFFVLAGCVDLEPNAEKGALGLAEAFLEVELSFVTAFFEFGLD